MVIWSKSGVETCSKNPLHKGTLCFADTRFKYKSGNTWVEPLNDQWFFCLKFWPASRDKFSTKSCFWTKGSYDDSLDSLVLTILLIVLLFPCCEKHVVIISLFRFEGMMNFSLSVHSGYYALTMFRLQRILLD